MKSQRSQSLCESQKAKMRKFTDCLLLMCALVDVSFCSPQLLTSSKSDGLANASPNFQEGGDSASPHLQAISGLHHGILL